MNLGNVKAKIILVGCFHEIIELCELCNKEVVGIIDNIIRYNYLGYKILGTDKDARNLYLEYQNIPIIINIDDPNRRKILAEYYSSIGFNSTNLISPKATISKYAQLGNGIVIQSGVNVSSMVTVEDFVKINVGANIMHDCIVGKYTTIAPNAVVLGRVKISESCYIGSNSTILPDIKLETNSIVGAGAIVTNNVRDNVTVIGNPAREK